MSSTALTLGVARIRPAYEQVANQLRALILSGSMKQGERLPAEGELAANFGVSRTTIREALRMLSSEDLVRTTRGVTGGTFVAELDIQGLSALLELRLGVMATNDVFSPKDLNEVRQVIELPSVRLAASRRTEADLTIITKAAEDTRMARTGELRSKFSAEFHLAVVDAAHNALLSSIAAPIFAVMNSQQQSWNSPETWARIDAEHFSLIEHLRNHDAEAAAHIASEHLDKMLVAEELPD
jgi:GntR family transcriptional repressor for pyruvate dehydrogenase complex